MAWLEKGQRPRQDSSCLCCFLSAHLILLSAGGPIHSPLRDWAKEKTSCPSVQIPNRSRLTGLLGVYCLPPVQSLVTKGSVVCIPYSPVAPKTHSRYPVDGVEAAPREGGAPWEWSECSRRNLSFFSGWIDTVTLLPLRGEAENSVRSLEGGEDPAEILRPAVF